MDLNAPTSELTDGGGRHRLRAVIVVIAVAAILATVGGVAWSRSGGSGGDDESTLSDQAGTPVTNAVWSVGDQLHDGGVQFTVAGAVATNLAPTLHGVAYGIENGDVIYQPTGGASVTIGHRASTSPAADPTSGLVAWFETTGSRLRRSPQRPTPRDAVAVRRWCR
jgi:hypothetical protein